MAAKSGVMMMAIERVVTAADSYDWRILRLMAPIVAMVAVSAVAVVASASAAVAAAVVATSTAMTTARWPY